jgi:hypothetical protein
MTTSSSAALGLALLLVACSGDPTSTNTPSASTARLRVVNASPEASTISVAIDGRLTVEHVAYLDRSSYVGVPAGAHTVEVRSPTGGAPLGTRAVTFEKDSAYTLVVTEGGGGAPLVAIDTGVVPAAGKVKFRVVHAAADAPPLEAFLTPSGASLADAVPYVTPFTYGVGTSDDSPGYFQSEPGEYQVRFTRAGTREVLLDSGPIVAEAGEVRSVFLVQLSDSLGGGLGVQILRDR